MDVLYRAASVCVIGSILALILRKNTPELALLLSLAAGVSVCVLCSELLREILKSVRRIADYGGVSGVLLTPVIKCTAISLISDYAANLCRDAGQSATASIVEYCGALCALYASLPLLVSLFDAVAGLLS